MRTFKFISILIFLAVFINGKASAPVLAFEIKKDHSSKEIKDDQKINADDKNDDSPHKRKRRPRGIEVDVPFICNISFEQPIVFTDFNPLLTKNRYSSFLHCVSSKRGPPLS